MDTVLSFASTDLQHVQQCVEGRRAKVLQTLVTGGSCTQVDLQKAELNKIPSCTCVKSMWKASMVMLSECHAPVSHALQNRDQYHKFLRVCLPQRQGESDPEHVSQCLEANRYEIPERAREWKARCTQADVMSACACIEGEVKVTLDLVRDCGAPLGLVRQYRTALEHDSTCHPKALVEVKSIKDANTASLAWLAGAFAGLFMFLAFVYMIRGSRYVSGQPPLLG